MAFGYTLTVAAGKIPSSQGDFTWLAVTSNFPTASKDGGASSILNGGGNLRAYVDDTKAVQLPIEIVTFVTGGSPDIQVWGLSPTLNVASTIYIEADAVATTQPAVGASFGRDAVWASFEVVLHLSETGTNGVFVDSTGNGHGTTLTTGATLGTTSAGHPFGSTWPDFTAAQALTLTSSTGLINNSAFSMSAWLSIDMLSNVEGLWGNRWDSPDTNWAQFNTSARIITKAATVENTAAPTFPAQGTTFLSDTYQDSSTLKLFHDGVLAAEDNSVTGGQSIVSVNDFRIGTYFDNAAARRYNGRICEVRVKKSIGSNDLRTSEYNNQNDAATFFTSSAWVDSGGGGITVTGATANYNYTGIDGSIDLTGEIIVTGSTANYNYTGITGSIDLTGEVIVTGATANYNYSGIAGTVEIGAEIIVVGQTANYNYAGIDGEVELTALITVIGQTANYDYAGIDADVIIQGAIVVTGNTANYDYTGVNATIKLQGPIVVNPRNIIMVKRKSNIVRVKRNSNTIQVR